LLWRALIDEPEKCYPGFADGEADVEVLEPQWMRDAMIAEIKGLSNLYGNDTSADKR